MAAMDAASEERVREHEEGLAALGAQYEERLAAAQRYVATAPPLLSFFGTLQQRLCWWGAGSTQTPYET